METDNSDGRNGPVVSYCNAGFMSEMSFWWLRDLFKKAYREPLKDDDVCEQIGFLSSRKNAADFERVWQNKNATENATRNIFWILFRICRPQVFMGYLFMFWGEASRFGALVLLRYIAEFIYGHSSISKSTCWLLMSCVMVFLLFYGMVYLNAVRFPFIADLKMKIILTTIIYKKTLRLSASAFDRVPPGYIISLLASDVEMINFINMYLYSWFLGPLQLAMIFIFEGFDIGYSILVGIAFFLMVMMVQMCIGIFGKEIRHKQAAWTDKRVQLLNEIIKAMKVIKMYGWEEAFANLANRLRRAEMDIQLWRSALAVMEGSMGYPIIKCMTFLVSAVYILSGNTFTTGAFLLLEERTEDEYDMKEIGLSFKDVNMSWPIHEKNDFIAVVGAVGSGKSMFLQACLKEMNIQSGNCEINGKIAYAPQEPWILSQSVRDNILLGSSFDKERYQRVIKECELAEDIQQFPERDLTIVGERGLTLSGGQKARLGLARAVYEKADIYLLDDPLAAVDEKVANKIFFGCFTGFLAGKLRVLVTHSLQYIPHVDNVALLNQGEMISFGSFWQTKELILQYAGLDGAENTSLMSLPLFKDESYNNMDTVKHSTKERRDVNERNAVSYKVYQEYMKAGKGCIMVPLILLFLSLGMTSGILHDLIYIHWTQMRAPLFNITTFGSKQSIEWMNAASELSQERFVSVQGLLTFATFLFFSVAYMFLTYMYKTASQTLYNNMFARVLKVPSYFFEMNPVGNVLNRFSRDTAFMDIHLLGSLIVVLSFGIPCVGEMIYVCVISPWCIIPTAIYVAVLVGVGKYMLPAVRDVKRLEAGLRSPVLSHVSSTIDGYTVIRSMRKQDFFISKAYRCIDQHSSASFNYICTWRCMGTIVDISSAIVICILLVILLLTVDKGNRGSVSLAFIYLPSIISNASLSFLYATHLETAMTSVERILQYSKLEQEVLEHQHQSVHDAWPQNGKISCNNTHLRYRGQETPALGPLNITIKPGEKIGVVGRTGAGKSSLIVALNRMVEPEGDIFIDGVNIKDIGLTRLRSSFSIIPQDPVLFNQSLRFNVDPFDEFKDKDIWDALEQVQLRDKVQSLPMSLSTEMGSGNIGFSMGEKQLLCLARAIMRKNKIVVIDEATANVDNRTDAIIQKSLQSVLASATVITIAHRINSLIATDRILVLQQGQVAEMGHPYDLLGNMKGLFYDMLSALGQENLESFKEAAGMYRKMRWERHGKSILCDGEFDKEIIQCTRL